MPERKVKRRRLKKRAVGDRDNRIKIHTRDIGAPGIGSAKFNEIYDVGKKRWSVVETLDLQGSAQKRFENVELSESPSHMFTIRYEKGITVQNVIQFDGDFYKIVATQNPDGRKIDLEIFAVSRGSIKIEANQ